MDKVTKLRVGKLGNMQNFSFFQRKGLQSVAWWTILNAEIVGNDSNVLETNPSVSDSGFYG